MIEVGEYIRTDKDTEVLKIIEVRKENKCITDKYPNLILQLNRDFTKHSKNIIDLIEVGDYVNGNLIIEECIDIKDDEEYLIGMCVKKGIQVDRDEYEEGGCIDIGDYFYFKPLENINIKNILTHEQYEQNCYKVVI